MPATLGTNTGAASAVLRRKIILCGGEDAADLLPCCERLWGIDAPPLRAPTAPSPGTPGEGWGEGHFSSGSSEKTLTLPSPGLPGKGKKYNAPPGPPAFFSYRCYKFWTWPQRTLIWTGIGTGCLEPLLWEIFQPGIVEDIILIGTAGRLPNSKLSMGVAGCVTEAYSGCTSIDDVAGVVPLTPSYDAGPASRAAASESARIAGPTCSAVSTDYYYGFSQRAIDGSYPSSPALRTAVDRHLHARDLVDMETAQFYYFCQTLGRPALRYLAIRAAANDIASQEEQLTHTPAALFECLKLATALQDQRTD